MHTDTRYSLADVLKVHAGCHGRLPILFDTFHHGASVLSRLLSSVLRCCFMRLLLALLPCFQCALPRPESLCMSCRSMRLCLAHAECLNNGEPLADAFRSAAATWATKDGPPLVRAQLCHRSWHHRFGLRETLKHVFLRVRHVSAFACAA